MLFKVYWKIIHRFTVKSYIGASQTDELSHKTYRSDMTHNIQRRRGVVGARGVGAMSQGARRLNAENAMPPVLNWPRMHRAC